ncbi:MAG: tetratricopeptide repeat protein [Candidatus Marinimicrobia bacterium]|nr:tetratricopeptide repeat protein [Candidatus Neomarinimicrobiota bacterium]
MKKTMFKKSLFITIIVAMIVILVFVTGCVPPSQKSADEDLANRKARRDSLRKANYHKCEFKMSNANQYKLQQDWAKSIENYKEVMELGCTEDFAQNLFRDMAQCYGKLGNNDSAIWAIEEALVYRPTDIYFLKLIAYYHKKEGNTNSAVKDWEKINTLFPNNSEYMFELADLYFEAGRYREEVTLLEQILDVEPDNKKAQLALVSAYEALGIDLTVLYKESYEKDKTNAKNGYRYGKELFNNAKYGEAISVLSTSKKSNPNNRSIIELLADCYDYKGMGDKSLEIYEELVRKYPNDSNTLIKVTGLNLDAGKFQEAVKYANKAVKIPSNKGDSYKSRGDVYYAIAEDCFSKKSKLEFSDKLVFHMAYEDYKNALANGNSCVKSKMNLLEKNEMIISSQSDYFLAPKSAKISSNEFKPVGDCYSWIKRTVKIK